ncbi:MAG: sporulation protein YunB [Clostridia bacterium]|nr:sporulation protein YunB [Clostridia bacterium]
MPEKSRKTFRIVILAALILLIAAILCSKNLSRMMGDMAYAQAYSMALEAINESVIQVISEGVAYDQLIHITMDNDGHVSTLRSDSIVMSRLATRTALIAEEKLNSLENQSISLPLGSALGVKFLAGVGPRVQVQIVPIGAVSATFSSSLSTAGINQTLHQVFLTLRATVRLIMPTGSQKVEVVGSLPVAENIIVGLVPDSFVDVGDELEMLELAP